MNAINRETVFRVSKPEENKYATMNEAADTRTPESIATAEAKCDSLQRLVVPSGLYRQFKNVQLYCGDCLDILPKLTGIDSVITDPPYGVELTAKRAKQRNGDTTQRAGEYCHEDTPLYVRSVVVPAIGMCLVQASCVLVTPGTRNMHLYPIPDDVGCFYSAAGTGMGRWGFTCMQPILYYGKDPYLARGLGGRANSCGQTYPNDANEQPHPCAKPIAWAQWLVARGSLEEMTVCDPFMGSGTTGIACIRGRRKFVGIEKDTEHFENARKRIERELQQGYMI